MNYGIDDIRNQYSQPRSDGTGGDGCHPTEDGYRQFLVPKIEAWMKTL
jgi:lysophospholipase L1-like esterase